MKQHGLDQSADGDPIYWYDSRRGQPKRRFLNADGIPAVEKLPQGPARRMVKPSGDIVFVTMSTAAAAPMGANAVAREKKKKKLGFIPADECPLVNHQMPKGLRKPEDEPCPEYFSQDGQPRALPDRGPCKHLQRVIEARRKEHAVQQEQFARGFMGDATRQNAEQAQAMRTIAETQKEIAAHLRGAPSKGKRDASND